MSLVFIRDNYNHLLVWYSGNGYRKNVSESEANDKQQKRIEILNHEIRNWRRLLVSGEAISRPLHSVSFVAVGY